MNENDDEFPFSFSVICHLYGEKIKIIVIVVYFTLRLFYNPNFTPNVRDSRLIRSTPKVRDSRLKMTKMTKNDLKLLTMT